MVFDFSIALVWLYLVAYICTSNFLLVSLKYDIKEFVWTPNNYQQSRIKILFFYFYFTPTIDRISEYFIILS